MLRVMKKIILMLVMCFLAVGLSACSQEIYAEYAGDDVYGEYTTTDVRIILTYGTPYYYNGTLWYYYYNGLYWYPFYYDNYWYFRPYNTIYPYGYNFGVFRPHPGDYRFRPRHDHWRHEGWRPPQRPNHPGGHITPSGPSRRPGSVNPRPGGNNRPHGNYGRPGGSIRPNGGSVRPSGGSRPSGGNRSFTPSAPRGNSGGSHGGSMRPGRR